MITYLWIIWKVECIPDLDGLKNVIKHVHWYRRAILDDRMATIDGWSTLDDIVPTNFVDYGSVTQEQITSWLESIVNVPLIDKDLKDMLDADRVDPITVEYTPSWVQT